MKKAGPRWRTGLHVTEKREIYARQLCEPLPGAL